MKKNLYRLRMTLDKRKYIIKILATIALLFSLCNGLLQAYGWQQEGVKVSHTLYIFFSSFIWCFIWGFSIGTLTTFIPYKQSSYKQRYLFHALSFTVLAAILLILSGIRMIYYTKYLYNF